MSWIPASVRRALGAGMQAGAAAGLAWWVGRAVLGVDRPLYAPVAAVVVLGAGYDRRVERVGAMLSGMAVAIAVSEIGTRLIGSGSVQIGLLTAVAIVTARLTLEDLLAVAYAGLNAAILVAIGGEGWVPDRLVEALLGAATAYALVYLVFPPHPARHLHRAIRSQVSTAAENLRSTAQALRSGDAEEADRADEASEQVDRKLPDLEETFDFSQQVARLSPWRRGERDRTDVMRRLARDLRAVLRDATALVRVARRHVRSQSHGHEHLADAVATAADALEALGALMTGDRDDQEALTEIRERAAAARRHAEMDCDAGAAAAHVATVEEVRALADRVDEWCTQWSDAVPAPARTPRSAGAGSQYRGVGSPRRLS